MNTLIEKSIRKISQNKFSYQRFIMHKINWKHRLISIIGSRGVGKTTLVLQYLKNQILKDNEKLYVSFDDIYFTKNNLLDFVSMFVKNGGKLIVLDEIHKYPTWSIEIKNIYDNYPDLQIVFTGSSILEINKGEADLSRRTVGYVMPTMSLREFIDLDYNIEFKSFTLEEILNNHSEIAKEINNSIKPILFYQKYIKYGCFPFYLESGEEFSNQLMKTINVILESDLFSITKIDYNHIIKLKKLLLLIAESVPFKPNISELSSKIGITRDSVINYLDFLQKAQLINLLTAENKGFRRFEKPEKIYLNNCNQLFAITGKEPNIGTIGETFFLQNIKNILPVNYSNYGDFLVSEKYVFEIGGKTKTFKQIKDIENSFLAIDDIEFGYKNKIPLWLFGFLY